MEITDLLGGESDGTIKVENGAIHYALDVSDLSKNYLADLISRAHVIKDLGITLDELLNSSMRVEVNINVSPSQDTSAYLKVTSEHINGANSDRTLQGASPEAEQGRPAQQLAHYDTRSQGADPKDSTDAVQQRSAHYDLPLTADEEKGVYTAVLVKLHKNKEIYEKWQSEASSALTEGNGAK